ncbi:MAG: gamma-glutamyltransferase, partial [Candidatus Rokuibacteriota bacterium]
MTEKRPATASRGMVVTNHPLGSAAGAEMLAAGGNAVDAAIGALFALTVVEPMMVGIFGAGMTHLRLADGRHLVIDNYTTAPAAARPDMFKPVSDTWPDYLRAEGDVNLVGLLSVGVPGTLKGWVEAVTRFGRLDLESVMQPAIRHAERGFRATPYLVAAVTETAPELARFPETARTFLPGGAPIKAGDLIQMPEYAATLRLIAAKGPGVLYGGDLGATVADYMRRDGGIITLDDLARYETIERRPIRGRYRGFEITGPPPPTAGGLHLVEMLNILEGFDPRGLGFGTADYFHLMAEVLKIGFADRNACTGDPAFVDIPVERLLSKEHAAMRRAQIRPDRAGDYGVVAGMAAGSAHTTHVTTADADGNVVAMTQTIHNLFGSKATVPGTGMLLNNTMALFDPHPGTPASIAPGKRVTSSMAPTIVLRDGKPVWALGLPGGVRIFTSVFQAVVNLIDHRMTLQEAVEAPRIWSQGQELEM